MVDDPLVKAYRNVFAGHSVDAQIVLNDLAQHTGFYDCLPEGATNEELRDREGARRAFLRIHEFLSQSDEGAAALDEAARTGK